MSKEQALKCSGLALQSSSTPSSVDMPSVTKTLLTTTKRLNTRTDVINSADGSALAGTPTVQILTLSLSLLCCATTEFNFTVTLRVLVGSFCADNGNQFQPVTITYGMVTVPYLTCPTVKASLFRHSERVVYCLNG